MHLAMRFHVGLMRTVGVIRTEVRDKAALLPRGQLIVANHPTLIDVVLLMSLTPDVGCVVKRGLWRNPFLRWPVVWAGYIPNSDGERLVADCSACLRSGRSLIVFPEGTRTVPGEPMSLKRGAAQIALAAQANVLPVTILCEPLMLNKGVPWYRVPPRPGRYTIAVGQPIAPQAYDEPGTPHSVAARHLTAQLATRFERELERLRRERAPNLDTIPHPPQSARL
jgi:1-acyl-sn-glycerol-3-phosphate acyltransferase